MNTFSPMIFEHAVDTRVNQAQMRASARAGFHETSGVNTDLASAGPIRNTSLTGLPTSTMSQHDKTVAQTRKWVAQTFFGTMLKQMRESPFKTDLSSGGRGGEVFGSMLDQHLAEKMARGSGSKLVNSIVRKIEAKQAYEKQSNTIQRGRRPDPSPSDALRVSKNIDVVEMKGAGNVAADH